jgi:hypothetical protein
MIYLQSLITWGMQIAATILRLACKNFLLFRNPYNKLWYHFDDERVNQVEESKIVSKSAYILFYRRKEKWNMIDYMILNNKGAINLY